MKKLTAILFACTMFICAAVSCGDTKEEKASSGSKKETTTVADTTAADVEAATEEAADKDDNDDKKDDSAGVTDKEVKGDELKEINDGVRKFAEITLTGEVDGLLKSMYPDSVVEALKNSEFADQFAEASDLMSDSGELKDCKAENVKELSEDALRGAEKYFETVAEMMGVDDIKAEVEKGYYLGMTVDIEKDGVKDGGTEEACFVYLKDEGWKFVPVEPSDLLSLLEEPDESTDTEESATATARPEE